jgi:hypothetical protein
MPDNSQELQILIKAQQQTTAAFEQARKELENLGHQGQKTNDSLGLLKTGLGALGIAFGAAEVIGFAKDIVATAGHVNDLAHAIGISTDAVQDFTLAAEQSGATIDDVGIAINKLNVEAGNNAKGFEQLGLSLEKIQALSPEERFRAVADALQKIEDPAVRAALGQELLGKGYRNLASAIDEGIGKTRDANKMSKETIETLDGLGDVIVRAGTKTKNFFGEALAKAVNIPRDLIRDMKADLDRLGISIDTIVAKAPGIPAAFRGQGPIRLAPLNTEEIAQIEDGLNKERKALDETAKAADTHAQKIKELSDAIFGRTAIAAANDYVQALGPINNLSKVSAENQKKINATVLEAIEAYERLGKTAPAALNQIYVLTVSLPEATGGVTNVIKDLGHEAEVTLPKLDDLPEPINDTAAALKLLGSYGVRSSLTLKDLIPDAAEKSKVSLDSLSRAIAEMATISGGSFGSVVRDLGSLIAAASTAQHSIETMKDAAKSKDPFESIVGMTSGILGIVTAAIQAGKAIANLFDRNKGRDLVVDFADTFGGFDALHVKLQALGDEGEQLWIKLTQGVGRNNPQQAQAAIDAVTKALDKQEQKQGDVQDQTEESALATIETATQASEALKTVGDQLETNKGQWADWSAAVMGEIQKVAATVGAVVIPSPGTSSAVPGFAGGTRGAYLDFGAGTPVVLHGRERVMTEREGDQSSGGGYLGTTVINIDGHEIARASTRYQRQVLAPYGVR